MSRHERQTRGNDLRGDATTASCSSWRMSKVKANRLPAAHVKSTPDPSPQVIQDIVSSFDSGFKYQLLGVVSREGWIFRDRDGTDNDRVWRSTESLLKLLADPSPYAPPNCSWYIFSFSTIILNLLFTLPFLLLLTTNRFMFSILSLFFLVVYFISTFSRSSLRGVMWGKTSSRKRNESMLLCEQ